MDFTKAQKKAIDDRSGSLLVSAGAGSGKTAVLTHRLVSRLSNPDDKFEITDFLAVTFTNAAASELRERLYKYLTDAAAGNPKNKKVLRQLSRIGLAKISTIHSFCFELIKQNFEFLSLPPKIRMADDAEARLLKLHTINEIVEEKYNCPDENIGFLDVVEIFSGAKSDKKFIEILFDLHDKIKNFPEPEKWFSAKISLYEQVIKSDEFFNTEYGKIVKLAAIVEADKNISELSRIIDETNDDLVISEKYGNAMREDLSYYEGIKDKLDLGYGNAKAYLELFKPASLKPIRNYEDTEYLDNIKEIKTACAKRFSKLREDFFLSDTEKLKSAAKETFKIIETLRNLIFEIDEEYRKVKTSRGIIDFSDAEQYALKLLVKNSGIYKGEFERTDLAQSFSEKLSEIYIDEYQDINPVQDMIFKAICRYKEQGSEHNRFMVGDIKQSIYRFRGARPELFENYRNDFSRFEEDLSDKGGSARHKLFLSDNFRCSENVVRFVNFIFNKIMDESYGEDDRLIFSKNEKEKVQAKAEFVLIPDTDDTAEAADADSSENEMRYIASRISEMVDNPKFLSSDGKTYKYSDIAVLFRSTKNISDEYVRYFERAGIPVYSDTPENFFENSEILLSLCLLKTIDNPQRDIYLAGLMRSPLFCFSDDELCEIRNFCGKILPENSSFWQCCTAYEESEGNLSNKVKSFVDKINSYRKLSRGTSADKLIITLYGETGLINICTGKQFSQNSEKSAERKNNLLLLYDMARGFEKTSFRGLSAFLEFLDDKISDGGRLQSQSTNASNCVKLMSVHKSKGLEFPVVFVAGLSKHFNTADERDALVISDNYGIGIKLRDIPGNSFTSSSTGLISYDTPFRKAVISAERKEFREEEKRILYVAMTRAKERLILTMRAKKVVQLLINSYKTADYKKEKLSDYGKSAGEWILNAVANEKCMIDVYSKIGYTRCRVEDNPDNDSVLCIFAESVRDENGLMNYKHGNEVKQSENPEITKEILSKLYNLFGFKYPYKGLSQYPTKLTVSQLKIGLLESIENIEKKTAADVKTPEFVKENKKATSAEKGTALHIFMQFADYSNCEANGAKSEAERLLMKGFITQNQYEILNLPKIDEFFKGSFYLQMKNSKNIVRELRFNMKLPVSDLNLSELNVSQLNESELNVTDFSKNTYLPPDEFVLVQGVIDCFFENADGSFTVVDFKTDFVNEEEGEKILIDRHALQLLYYARAVEEMTGKKVSRAVLYSFSLMREIEV